MSPNFVWLEHWLLCLLDQQKLSLDARIKGTVKNIATKKPCKNNTCLQAKTNKKTSTVWFKLIW